ncbi:UNC-50 family protein [Heterostelium album PN500]|uniref:UNC-50 family protein n=1 Tax=Heterostelium pallidum (strain ATCC 26659 / Pp 5 / PN500) TaxID=670386 RepID=D3B9T4_HETP5|nr:UNC-50 family protein [Heterostelium album PN500]EFA81996.1 UNC-50 family protein [Heterostelium album PN500]|eukprot:XP_020434113.1 UNC-50 family protein [Heterostelium album PN500]
MLGGVTRTSTSLHGDSVRYKRIVPEYFRRIFHYPQMDIEYTFWIMFYLCFNPARVYRNTSWHKQTKNQWARDDPAFVVILVFFMSIASMSYAIAFHYLSILHIIKTMFWAVFFDFITVGLVVATAGWWISNHFLRESAHHHSVDQKVEWLYAFDIHCNSFFPLFIILYVIHFFLLPVFMSTNITIFKKYKSIPIPYSGIVHIICTGGNPKY